MTPGDGLGNGQPQSRTAGLARPAGIAAVEALKDPFLLSLGKSWPLVAPGDTQLGSPPVQFDAHHPTDWAVLDGVAEQVGQQLASLLPHQLRRARSGAGDVHLGGHVCQPALRFSAQSLIASTRVISLRLYRCAEGCAYSSGGSPAGITSPTVSSSDWLHRS